MILKQRKFRATFLCGLWIWNKLFKSGLSKFCGRQPLKNSYPFKFLKAVFHKIYSVYSGILFLMFLDFIEINSALSFSNMTFSILFKFTVLVALSLKFYCKLRFSRCSYFRGKLCLTHFRPRFHFCRNQVVGFY